MQEIETLVSSVLTDKSSSENDTESKTSKGKTINKSLKSANNLSNHLPTGTALIYQLLSPVVTKQGHCHTVGRILTLVLVAACGMLCFFASFTDSFKDKKGNICFGIATIRGLWVIDGSEQLPAKDAAKYKLQAVDFLHAFMTLLVFASLAISDANVVGCFYPTLTTEIHWILIVLPIGVSAICSALFVAFPTKRHGLGFPVSDN